MINFCLLHFFLSKFRKIFTFCANLCLCYWNCFCICHLRGFFLPPSLRLSTDCEWGRGLLDGVHQPGDKLHQHHHHHRQGQVVQAPPSPRWTCTSWWGEIWTNSGAGPWVLRGWAWHRREKLFFLGGLQVLANSSHRSTLIVGAFLHRLVPTPACNMGYCVGEGVPCPKGLASTNGYTPCDCEWTFILVFIIVIFGQEIM